MPKTPSIANGIIEVLKSKENPKAIVLISGFFFGEIQKSRK